MNAPRPMRDAGFYVVIFVCESAVSSFVTQQERPRDKFTVLQAHTSTTMTSQGSDCYFFYYSTYTKGDECRDGEQDGLQILARGTLLQACVQISSHGDPKNQQEKPCYFEKQPVGCQNPHCAFFHKKPHCNDGEFIPPSKSDTSEAPQNFDNAINEFAADYLEGDIDCSTDDLLQELWELIDRV